MGLNNTPLSERIHIGIFGRRNAGKSSVINAMTGQNLAIVSDVAGTTTDPVQKAMELLPLGPVVMIDTPGLDDVGELGKMRVEKAYQVLQKTDIAVIVIDASVGETAEDTAILAEIQKRSIPYIIVKNKADLTQKQDGENEIFVSAKTGEGIEALLSELKKHAENSPHFFPDDTLTDQPERVLAAEMIREKMLRLLDKEIPHGVAVSIELMRERDTSDIMDIEATIYCERESHKGIIIGKGGSMLKKISTFAREDMEKFFGIKVNLRCWVKVKEDWRNREGLIHNFGLD